MRMASSTRRARERTRENIERKFNVCHARLRTTNVSKKTRGIVSVGTSACLKPTKRKSVPQTRKIVIIKSRVKPETSSRICSEKSVVVCNTTSDGIIPDVFMFSSITCPLSTRSIIEPHDFFTTERVTAGTDFCHPRDNRDSLSRLMADSVTIAISRRKIIPGSPMLATGISRKLWRL